MNFYQDFVLLHIRKQNENKPDERFPGGLVYDPDNRDTSYLEMVLIGIGALVMLGVTAVLSIPDKTRQEEDQIYDGHHDFNIEACESGPKLVPVDPAELAEPMDPARAKLRLCAN